MAPFDVRIAGPRLCCHASLAPRELILEVFVEPEGGGNPGRLESVVQEAERFGVVSRASTGILLVWCRRSRRITPERRVIQGVRGAAYVLDYLKSIEAEADP